MLRPIIFILCFLLSSPVTLGQFLDARRLRTPIAAHAEWGSQVLWSPDGETVVTAGIDGYLRIWEATTGKKLREIKPAGAKSILCSALSDNGQLVAGDSGGRLFWIDLKSGKTRASAEPTGTAINSIALAPTGLLLAAGYSDGFVRIWNTGSDGRPSILGELKTGFGTVTAVALFTDRNRVVAGGYTRGRGKGQLACWDWTTKERQYVIEGAPACRSLTISPDGRLMAAASFDPAVTLFSLPGQQVNTLEMGTRVADNQDEERSIGVWETATGKLVAGFEAELGASSLAFSRDGRLLASGGEHGVLLYEVRFSSVLREKGRINSRQRIASLAFSPNAKKLVVLRENGVPDGSNSRASGRLSNPLVVAAASLVHDGLPLSRTEFPAGETTTGGSSLDFWGLIPRHSAELDRVWDAMDLVLSGKRTEAATALNSIMKDHPASAEARRLLAVSTPEADADKILEDALKLDPRNAAVLRSRADLAYQGDDLPGAVEWYRRTLEVSPEDGLVEGRLALALLGVAMSGVDPNSPDALQKSIGFLLEAIRLRPANPRLHSNLGSLYYFNADADRAIVATEEAIALDPLYSRAYYNLGHCYVFKGERGKALQAYRRYVALGEKGQEARLEKTRKLIEELSRQELKP